MEQVESHADAPIPITPKLQSARRELVPFGNKTRTLGAFALFYLFDELRDDFEDVADDAEVGILKNRRFGILIDRDNELGSFHSGKVLHGTGDAAGDI